MSTMEPVLLRVPEVAQLLNIGRTRVYDLIRTGELVSVKVFGSRRVPRSALDAYVASLIEEVA
ncbi:helix-turn-helix domain-containing protein [Allosaccharopolyspora coralli]|uniref:Helix-turn-helix domain-containing protein n=1 Tax=Allosaccharopolyspora coralli TaxID=2665642 RepID=A0A5Q3Q2Z7_9PSEU|nr:helix-turn-helix domain-containing protein [Allosaccharopolyspora coralli]QGK68968.1 helix-turn-helix domain-containing protein [Allosaccharopolyspora coralli]